MSASTRLSSLVFAALLSLPVLAQQAQVRVEARAGQALWVGQQVSLYVTLLAPGYFASAASFDLPDPAGVLLMPPQAHPVVGNETIDGVMYTTQLHELRAWPMRAGAQQVPPLTIRFAYRRSPLDADDVSVSVTSKPVPLRVEQPPGTAGMGTVISARNLSVNEQWEPDLTGAPVEAGAAYTRTITFSAPDMPGMIFPPFPAPDIEGLGVYSKPQVSDHNDPRSGLVGERRETITYVAKSPGQYIIPAVEFHWFDLDARQLETETFAARTLEVIANPAMASGAGMTAGLAAGGAAGGPYVNWGRLIYLSLGLLLLLYLSLSAPAQALARHLETRLQPRHLQPLHPPAK